MKYGVHLLNFLMICFLSFFQLIISLVTSLPATQQSLVAEEKDTIVLITYSDFPGSNKVRTMEKKPVGQTSDFLNICESQALLRSEKYIPSIKGLSDVREIVEKP